MFRPIRGRVWSRAGVPALRVALRPCGLAPGLLAAGLIGVAAPAPAAAGEIINLEAEAGAAVVAVALQGERLTLDARGAPLAAVLEAIAAEVGFALVVRGDLDRSVTQSFERLALDRAIRRVVGRDALLMMRYARAPPGRQLVEVHVRAASGTRVVRAAAAAAPAASLDADRPTRVGEVRRLARRGDASAVAGLARHLEEDDDRVVRRLVVESLGEIGDPRALPALAAALDDDDPTLRGRAIAALRAVGGARAAAAIGEALHEDPDPRIRRMAARALGRMDHDAAMAALEAAQTDPNENVRASVEAALTRAADAP